MLRRELDHPFLRRYEVYGQPLVEIVPPVGLPAADGECRIAVFQPVFGVYPGGEPEVETRRDGQGGIFIGGRHLFQQQFRAAEVVADVQACLTVECVDILADVARQVP